ncbi:MAG: SDR family oxidoreductase [Rhodospirillaceae bacterium]|nr:SDR family oxidoreductase [Rhodospirillaceae bacterium]MBT7356989.1 SDR family oxidoreductase [Rhodospirillaceae bacterium]
MEQIAPVIDFKSELSNRFALTNKVAYLPGGYGGIGEAIAWGMAVEGATVVIGGRNGDKASALAKDISDAGLSASALSVDVKSVGEIKDSVDAVVDQHGKIDILMNCVGIQIEQPLLDVTEEAYDEVIEVNLKASMFLAQAVARRQIEAGNGGKQVHLLSVRAQLGIRKRGYSAYCSSKGGQVMLIKQHAMELAPHNINVNGVAPTFVYTEMIRHVMENDEFRQGLLDRIPLGRIADPKDIVGPAVFFSSPAADFVTAQIMYVDGGITASQ